MTNINVKIKPLLELEAERFVDLFEIIRRAISIEDEKIRFEYK